MVNSTQSIAGTDKDSIEFVEKLMDKNNPLSQVEQLQKLEMITTVL